MSSGADGTRSALDIKVISECTHYEYQDNSRSDDLHSESITMARRCAMSTLMLTSVPTTRPRGIGRRVVRLMAVAAAMASALAIWVIADSAFGIDLRAPAFDGSAETLPIRVQDVLLVSAMLSFAGWGFIAVLERLTARARRVWLVTAVAALALSLGTPLAGAGVTLANRVVLMLMHLAVGSVLIPALYRSSPRREDNS